MSALLHIAIDAMSGDCGPSVCVPAALAAAREFPDVRFTLIGRQADLERQLATSSARAAGAKPANVDCLFAAQVVEMTDHPREALRRKKDSSMRRALDLVKAREADACVSAGNTGALMAMAHFVLKMLPGVERPAIVSMIPSRGGHTYMLDLGANASCTPEQLCQFAVMGSVLAADLEGAHERPRVGLLNIGEEEIKGHETVQTRAQFDRGERRQLCRLRRGTRHIFRQGGRGRDRRLYRQRRAEDHGGRGAADRGRAARGVHAQHGAQARRAGGTAEPERAANSPGSAGDTMAPPWSG